MTTSIKDKVNLKAHIDLLVSKGMLAPKSVQLYREAIHFLNLSTVGSSNIDATWRYLLAQLRTGKSSTFILKTISIIKGALRLNRIPVHRNEVLEMVEFEPRTMKSESMLE